MQASVQRRTTMKYPLPRRVGIPSGSQNSTVNVLQITLFGSLLLYLGRSLFIPISYALLISFILFPICKWMETKGIGKGTAIFINLTILFLFLAAIVYLMIHQFSLFLHEWPDIYGKLTILSEDLSNYFLSQFAISKQQQQLWLSELTNSGSSGWLSLLQSLISLSMSSGILLVLIPIYAALILYYRQLIIHAVAFLLPKQKMEETKKIVYLAVGAYYNFIKGMILVYLIVGVLNSIGLLIIGVPHAIFFGFIVSILTFIPYIGIIIGSLLPVTMAWITFGSVWYPIAVIGLFVFIQYLEANVIFPLTVSNRLSINPLATLIAIMVGGILWGVSGMILFVPFLAILKLIADRHPSMKIISILAGKEN